MAALKTPYTRSPASKTRRVGKRAATSGYKNSWNTTSTRPERDMTAPMSCASSPSPPHRRGATHQSGTISSMMMVSTDNRQ
eukprot:scaffold10173_cov119-Isochrysis_galbana.AAC.5